MSLLLPNLDDRTWDDLVREGMSLIPLYAPQWTDHNVHDPGITLMELFAWIAEMDIYRLNRIPDAHKLKFLALAGISPNPLEPAQVVLRLSPVSGLGNESTLAFPASTEFEGNDPYGSPVTFRTLDDIALVPGALRALQVKGEQGLTDHTRRWRRGEALAALGEDPLPGSALYLGFEGPLPKNLPVSLILVFDHAKSGEQERKRILQEKHAQSSECGLPSIRPIGVPTLPLLGRSERIPPHHSAQTTWEFFNGKQQWQALNPKQGQVEDDTRALTLDGRVLLRVPDDMAKTRIGRVDEWLFYIRCRFSSGAYDAAPRLLTVVLNGVQAEQTTASMNFLTWVIAKDAEVTGKEPLPGELASFDLALDLDQQITRIAFAGESEGEDQPEFLVLDYRKPSQTTPGLLSIEAELLGYGTERPFQELRFTQRPVKQSGCMLLTLEKEGWRRWMRRPDLHASGRCDAHFLLDAERGRITIGDGEKGRVVPRDVPIISRCNATRAEAGNLNANSVGRLADTVHNRAVLADFDAFNDQLDTVDNPLPAEGGAPGETLEQAIGRVLHLLHRPTRAVNVADYEALAAETPGVHLARVFARANVHPSFPCLKATGIISLVVVPFLPKDRPSPSTGLCRAVSKYLNRHRIIGTRVEVIPPSYLEVAVQADVKTCAGTDTAATKNEIVRTLDGFFHPLTGGPEMNGWAIGRDVYRADVLEMIDRTPGVDHVLSLQLIPDQGEPQCGTVCVGPFGLVVAGEHRIQVM